ncbi:MAG: N-acetylglucosamine-6-phosphate deacetylase [Clostridia bacterium]|nr:N-acetylglucosamine-6-phosphate deacetylase [Clostridia bacterium]
MIIKNGNVVLPTKIIKADIRVENGKITEISAYVSPKTDEEVIDASGKTVTSGFVDIHTHGGFGADFMDKSEEAFSKALSFHLSNGTTNVVATSCTAPKSEIVEFLQFCKNYMSRQSGDCKVVGAHVEGPYLSKRNKGAQKEEDLLVPSKDDYSFLLDFADVIKTVTISPELEGAGEMTRQLVEKGIVVSGGHDDGVYPDFMPAIENGLSHLTHLYCAMSELRFVDGVRNVGLREYALLDDRLTAEIIADNKHIPPLLARMIIKAKGSDKVCVVSDSLRCAGMKKDGKVYKLGSGENAQDVIIGDGVATLADSSRFAGSITSVRQMVKNLVDAGIPLADAVRMGTLNPAKVVKIDKAVGSLEVGKLADICILSDGLELVGLICNGKKVI